MKALKNEVLNMVAGGTIGETCGDSVCLAEKGCMKEAFNQFDLIINWAEDSHQVDEGWHRAGITSVTHPFTPNHYFKNGKEITRRNAIYGL